MKTSKPVLLAAISSMALLFIIASTAQEGTEKTTAPAVKAEKPPVKPVEAKKAAVRGEKSAKEAPVPATNAAPVKIQHAGIGAKVIVSSTHKGEPGEGTADALVDGDLSTRWSSEYSTPQCVTIDLGKVMKISKIRLHWEPACATRYCVSISQDMKQWTSMHFFFNTMAKPEARIDDIDWKNVVARGITLDLQARVSDKWGFSLYEIEVQAREE